MDNITVDLGPDPGVGVGAGADAHRPSAATSARPSRILPTGLGRSTTRSCAGSPAGSRAGITATGSCGVSDPLRVLRGHRRRRGGSSAVRCATACWTARPPTSMSCCPARSKRRRPERWRGRPGGFAFELSEAFGAWRVVAHDHGWQVDLLPLDGATHRGGSGPARPHSQRDRRAAARPSDYVDPFGGACRPGPAAAAGRLTGGVPARPAADAASGPAGLRAGLRRRTRRHWSWPGRRRAAWPTSLPSGSSPSSSGWSAPNAALEGPGADGADRGYLTAILPELAALRGVEQSRFHHLDVSDHTRAVLAEAIALERDPERLAGSQRRELAQLARPSRWPTSSPAARRCASAPSCTTSPSRRPAR